MKTLVIVLALLLASPKGLFAANNEIIHVQRNLPMSEDDPIYKDYYISGGSDSGLKENLVVRVMRIVHVGKGGKVADGMKIEVPVGLLKVIYMRPQMSVARLYAAQDIENTPNLDTPAILVGDTVDLTGSFMDTKKRTTKSKVKQIVKEATKEAVVAVVIDAAMETVKEVPKESSNDQNNSLPMDNAGT